MSGWIRVIGGDMEDFQDDKIMRELKNTWKNQKPHLKNISIVLENRTIVEREGDETRRTVANDFLQLLKENINKIKPEIVKTKTGVGLFLDYSSLLKEKFEILFYVFEDGNADLGYWDNDKKLMYVNILDNVEFTNIIKNKKYLMLFDIYSSVIFHELIHRFDHMRYLGRHKPLETDAYVNTYEEFNAFYQQYARSVDILVSKMKTIDEFYKRFGISAAGLIADFWKIVPNDMKKEIKSSNKWNNKWNKRLYQLYYEKLSKFQKNRNS